MPPYNGHHSHRCTHARNIRKYEPSENGPPPPLARLSVRGILEASHIVTNVVAWPGEVYAGMRRRWLLHLGELTFESEGTISYRNSLMFLRDRRIVEATGTVGNVVAPCGEMSARIAHIIMSALRIDIKKKPS